MFVFLWLLLFLFLGFFFCLLLWRVLIFRRIFKLRQQRQCWRCWRCWRCCRRLSGHRISKASSHVKENHYRRRLTPSSSSSSSVGPSYGGGRYYGGGASTPYRAGSRSPLGGILPFALVGGAIAAAAIFPGLWLYGAYEYNYNHPYSFRNRTNSTATQNETLPVTCLCAMYSACGCDDNGNSTFLDTLVGNGSYQALNKSQINVANVNGTRTIVLNGTLPNGTDTSGASATTSSSPSPTSGALARGLMESSGYWALGGIVGSMVWLL